MIHDYRCFAVIHSLRVVENNKACAFSSIFIAPIETEMGKEWRQLYSDDSVEECVEGA